jgi:hypothetical protein
MRPTAQGADKKYSPKEMEDILSDVLDPSKVQLVCGKHNYIAGEQPPPPVGCKMCWQAYWLHKIASTPPHLRQQRLDEAYVMLRHANEEFEAGRFDFNVFDHAGVEQTKE